MSGLFDILDGIISSDFASDIFGDSDQVVNYAEAAGESIAYSDAAKIIAAGNKWVDDVELGNGEWSRMREDARESLEACANIDKMKLEESVAEWANTNLSDVLIDSDGDIHDGRAWLDNERRSEFYAWLAAQ